MSFNVRIFGHAGLTRMKVLGAQQFSSDSVYQLQQPYLWNKTLVTSGATPVTWTQTTLPAGQTRDVTDILRIEVPDGSSIRYEANPPGRSIAASVDSPILTGRDQIKWGEGWQLSIIDASAVAS